MIKRLFHSFYFMTGLIYILLLLGMSFGYHFIYHDVIREAGFQLNKKGVIDHSLYFSPLEYPPFGTDFMGNSLFSQFLIGAKYTIGLTCIIAILRLAISLLLGSVLGIFLPKIYRLILPFVNGYKYYPAALLCYFIVMTHITRHASINLWFIMIVLVIIAIPTASMTIAGEMNEVLNKPFIECSIVLGATKWMLLRKHVRLFVLPQLSLIFIRELVQTILVIAHLAVLHVSITSVDVTHEWAGLFGAWWDNFWKSTPWQALETLLWITSLMLAFHAMAIGLEKVLHFQPGQNVKRHKELHKDRKQKLEVTNEKFTFVQS